MSHSRIARPFLTILQASRVASRVASLVLLASLFFAQTATTQGQVNADPTMTILTPTSGQVVNTAYVDVSFTTANFTIGAWGASHAAFFLDADPQPYDFYNGSNSTAFGNKVVFRDFSPTPAATWVNNTTLRFNELPNGSHTITARLVDSQGNPLPYPTASFTVAFTVEQMPDNVETPNALVFVKEQLNPQVPPPNAAPGMGRVFNANPPAIGDLYLLSPVSPEGTLYQLTDVAAAGGGVIDPEVSYDGERVLFSMRQTSVDSWHIWEMNLDGSNLHQITFDPPHLVVNDQDPDYLPDGRIVFASDRLKQREMKPYDQAISTQLYTVNADGSNLHQIDYNANFDINPQVSRDGQILFDRWDHLNFMRNLFTLWRMNADGTNGFVYYGGVSPRFNQQGGENANSLESRELTTGELVGIFTQRDSIAGKMAIFDPRSFNLENLPFPLPIGPTTGFYRTPYPLTDAELIYSYTPDPAPQHNGFGLYTMQLTPEAVLVDDTTNSTAPGPGVNPTFRTYNIELSAAGRIYIEVSGIADENFTTPDRAWLRVDGVDYDGGTQDIERKLDGSLTFGEPYSYRIDLDLPAGPHTINIATDVTPTITHVRIVRAIAAANHALFYDDPATNEVSPIPVRVRNLPPTYASQTDDNLNWGTFVVRDVSLRGDFRQVNFNGAGGDPNYPYHMDLGEIDGLRVKQNLSRRSETQDILVGATFYDPVRVVGVAAPNATGTVAFKTLAGVTTAWDLIDEDGGALVHERVWSWVQPGEVRSCNGCHVGAFPYEPRAIGAIPSAQDLRQRGEVYTFVDQVLPIIADECDNCHTGQNPAGGLNLKGDRASFDALLAYVGNRTPTQYAINGEARFSFLYQLLSGRVNINPDYTARLNQINNQVNHTFMLSSSELYDIATWLDMGAGFAYLPLGFQSGDPRVVSVLPAHNANGVRRDTGVAVHFSAPIDRATVNSSTFALRRSNGQTISGSWEWGTNNDVFFRPYSNLPTGQYELTISGSILDIENALPGSPLAETFISNFSVVSSYDNSDPDVDDFLPGNNANPFAIVTVVFDEPIDPGSVNDQTFTVVDSKGFYVDGRITVSANGLEASWIPWAPWSAGETYEVTLSSGIRDLARNHPNTSTFHFTVATTPEPQYHSQIAAVPTDIDPKRMALNQDGTEFLVANKYNNLVTRYEVGSWDVIANYPLAAGPTDVAYSADDARAYVLNTVANNVQIIALSDGAIMATISDGLITPDWLLPDHEGSRLYVSDIGGTGYIHEIDVVLGSPTFGEVLRTFDLGKIPARPAISADDQTIYFGSSLAFNILDVAAGTVTQSIALTYGTVGPVILAPDESYALAASTTGGTLRYIDLLLQQDRGVIVLPDDADHLAFSPNGNFLYLALRTTQSLAIMDVDTWQVVAELVGVTAGDTFIQSLVTSPDGQLVFTVAGGLATEVLVYQVADPNDVTPPAVIGHAPANGSADQPVHVPIHITFSEPIDRLTLNAGNFTVTDGSGAPVAGRIEVQLQGASADFVPDTVLLPDQTYTISLSSGVRDLSGNSLAPFAYSFATVGTPTPTYHGQITAMPTRIDPKRMALNNAGTEFLVANKHDNLVTRHAVGSWETIASYPVAAGPFDVAYSADGAQAYVLNTTALNVQILDLSTGQILVTIGAPLITPDRLLVNHAGTRLYVSDIGGAGAIHEIDVVADSITFGDVLRTFDLERIPAPPAISADDAYLYFGSSFAFNTLDIAAAQISNSIYIPYGTVGPVAISADGAYAVAPSLSAQTMRLIDLTIEQDRSQITLPDNVDHMAFSPDGRFLYLVLRATQNLAVMDTASLQIISELPTFQVASTYVQGLAVSSGGEAPGQIFAVAGGLASSVLAFEVADPNDVTPPSVAGFTPAAGSSDQPVHAPLRITFSERVDRLTLNAGTLTVTDSSGAAVDGWIYPHLTGADVDFLPGAPGAGAPLTPGETYTVSLSSDAGGPHVRDLSGNNLAAFAYSFTAVDAPTSLYHGQRAAVPTRIDPKRLALNHAGTEFLVASKYENVVTRYAVGTWETLGSYAVAAAPYDVAYSADDALAYVLHTTAKNVQILDLGTGQILQTIGAPLITPDRLLLNHAGTRLYVSDIGGAGAIHEIDVVAASPTFGSVLRTFNLGRVPSAPAISANDAALYFGSPLAFNTLNLTTAQISNSLYVPYGTVGPVAVSPDGAYALVPSLSAQAMRLIDLNIQQERATITLPDNVDHMAFSPDGRFLYLVLRASQNIAIMDTATWQIVAELSTAQPATTIIQSLTVSAGGAAPGRIFAVAGGLAASTLVFEPADPNDATAPAVTDVTPAGGSSDLPLTTSIRVAFSEPLDLLTVNSGTFSLTNSSGSPVNGSLVIHPNGQVVNFLPAGLLPVNDTYTVSLTSDVHDLAGNALPPTTASFSTVGGPLEQYHAQLAAVDTGIDPKRLAVNHAGTEILVANKYNNLVTRYAIGSWAELAHYPVGVNPYDVAYSADDALAYVLNTGDNAAAAPEVQFLDLSDGTILHTTTGFSTPDRLRLNHSGDRLYVNDTSGTGAIYELDALLGSPTFGEVLRTFNVGKVPSRPVVSPDDQYLYFGSPLAFNILDIAAGVIVASFPLPYGSVGPIVVAPDGSYALAPSSNTRALRRIDLNLRLDRGEVALPDNPDNMVFSPDGRFLYMVMRTTQDLAVMDVATLQIVANLPADGNDTTAIQGLAVSPDNGFAQYVFAVAGGAAEQILVYQPGDMNDAIAPTATNVTPANGSSNNPVATSIQIGFSEPLDRLTLHSGTFALTNSNGDMINGTIYANGSVVNFLPAAWLSVNEAYTVSLTSGVRDLAGNSLSPYVYSFTTVSGPAPQYHGQLAAVDTGIDPKRLAVNHAGTEILVANKYNNLVTRYAIGSWAELAQYPVGVNPYDVAYSADDALAYVLNTGDNAAAAPEVQFLDLSDGTILHTTTGFSTPDRLRLNHSGDRLYVNDTSGTGAIYELDALLGSPTFGEVLRTFNVGKVPSRPVVSPDDQYLYFGSPLAFNILDIAAGVIVASFPLPYGSVGPVAVTPDGALAFAPSSNTRTLRLIDLNLRLDRGEVALPDNPDNMVFSPDGRFLYMVMRTTQDLAIMDVATLQLVANLPADGNDTTVIQGLAVSPDNGFAQYVFAVAGGAAEQILVYQPGDMNDAIAPTVTEIMPGNATSVPVYAPISAAFSEPLDRLTVNAGNIWLDGNGAPQNGTLHISGDNGFAQTVQFAPALLLQPLTSYTLHLEHTLADLAGNTLGLSQTSTFTTAATLDPGPLNLMSQTFSSNGSRGLALSPDGALLAVSNRFQNTVSLLHPDTMQPLRVAISVGTGPRGLAFNSDGSRLYVVTNPGNTLVEINVSTGQIIRTIANVLANEEVVISPDGSYAYTTGFNNGAFQQIDLVTGAVAAPLGAVTKPGRPAYAPDGTLYLATNNTLWRQNGDGSWTAMNTNSAYTLDVAFSADSRYAFMAETGRDSLLVVDLLQDAVLVEIPLGDEPRQVAQSADHRFLFVSNKASATIQIVDTMTLAVVRQVSLPGSQMMSIAWDEAGQRLFVTDVTNNLVRGFSLNYVAPPPVTRDDSSYELLYNQWQGVSDANALGGGYRAASAASQWVSYKSPATTEFNLITYLGPDQGKAYIKVDGATISTLDLYAPTPQYQAVFTFTNLTDAPHNIVVTAAGQQNPESAGTEVRVDGFTVNGQTIDDTSLSLNYHGWSSLSGAWATNGAARMATTPGNSITFTVQGDAFIWRTATCPTCGQAEIQVDGNVLTMVDLYSPAWQVQYGQLVSGLGSGGGGATEHQITITILSTKNPASGGTLVILDGYIYPSP